MELKLQRFSPQVRGRFTSDGAEMSPSPFGEWVRYDSAVLAFAAALVEKCNECKRVPPNPITDPLILCHEKIEYPQSKGLVHSYCYLPKGHEGKCRA